MAYKLSSSLFGHGSDVRAVASFQDGTIVSASRDKTACVWKPTGNGTGYIHSATLKGHSNFVSSVCVLNPSTVNSKGFIVTGSNDNNICVYTIDGTEPIKTINAHQNTVCHLATGKVEGTFLSSSWDQSIKLWDIRDLDKPQLTLVGHTAAVWCAVDLANGIIVTGSADKLVILWTRDGKIKHKLTGHDDCIRGIAPIKDDEFLTCANDATVRHWSTSDATCIGTYYGHENYIYGISATLNGVYVYTASEDRTIRIWHNCELEQTITLPTQSVWCIDLLENGDIVSGSSDGVVRIFSKNPDRYASAEHLERFEEEVANTKLNAQQEIGNINVKTLPDKKALAKPGQKEGQTIMIREGDSVKAYCWSQNKRKWQCVGDVVGAPSSSGKQLYNGIEYDYVFSIDVQDGAPALKLPYNRGEDPWHVAQKFLHDNDLSQLFLDQVANFIIKNSEPAPTLNSTSQYVDPFTGGNRYIPDSGTEGSSKPSNLDSHSASSTSISTSYIPHMQYLKFEQANIPVISDKLRELNSKQDDKNRLFEEQIEIVIKLAETKHSEYSKDSAIENLKVLLNWPDNVVFPALDVARLAVLDAEVNELLCTDELLPVIRKHVKSDAIASNQMLAFRIIANMFCHRKGEQFSLNHKNELLKAIAELNSLGNKNTQIAISTFILNLIIALSKHNDKSGKMKVLNVIFTLLLRLNEHEAIFRILVGLGTLLISSSNVEERSEFVNAVKESETAINVLRTISENSADVQNKLVSCSKQIIDLILQ